MENPLNQKYSNLVKTSKVKELLNDQGYKMSAELIEALNDVVVSKLTKAAKRCTANGRTTMYAKDL